MLRRRGRRRGRRPARPRSSSRARRSPGAVSFGPEPAHPPLHVGRRAPAARGPRRGQHHVGVGVDRLRRVTGHGHDEVAGRERLLATARSGKSLSGSAPSRISEGRAVTGAGRLSLRPPPAGSPRPWRRGCPPRRARAAGTEPQAAVKRFAARSQVRPARQARGQAHVERTEDVAPAAGAGRNVGSGSAVGQRTEGGSATSPDSAKDGRPPRLRHRATRAFAPGGPGPPRAHRRPARRPRGGSSATRRRRRPRSAPSPPTGVARPDARGANAANWVSAVGLGRLDQVEARCRRALCSRRNRTGSPSRRLPAKTTSSRRRAGLVDGGPGHPSTRSPGRPSPSWASTESVPIVPSASLAQAYADSLVRRAPPITPTAPDRRRPSRR